MPVAKNSPATPRWIEVRVVLPAGQAESFSEAALTAGALAATIEDADAGTPFEQPQFDEPGERPATLWQRSVVALLLAVDSNWEALLAHAAEECAIALPPIESIQMVGETDWVRQTQNQFPPIAIAQGALWIVPSWHEPPATTAPIIRLDPGLAFGTGAHPTTALCLEWLVAEVTPDTRVLDYGCGSGILAIAAAKLGAGNVTAVDIDPDALAATRANAAENSVTLAIHSADEPLAGPFDRVVANILTRPLIVLAPTLSRLVAPSGKLALAGILSEQADEVIAAYAPWLTLRVAAEKEGWVRLEGSAP